MGKVKSQQSGNIIDISAGRCGIKTYDLNPAINTESFYGDSGRDFSVIRLTNSGTYAPKGNRIKVSGYRGDVTDDNRGRWLYTPFVSLVTDGARPFEDNYYDLTVSDIDLYAEPLNENVYRRLINFYYTNYTFSGTALFNTIPFKITDANRDNYATSFYSYLRKDDEYKVVLSDTLTESKTLDITGLNLKGCVVKIEFADGASITGNSIYAYSDSTIVCSAWINSNTNTSQSGRAMCFEASANRGFWECKHTQINPGGNGALYMPTKAFWCTNSTKNHESITRLRTLFTIPSGSIVTIFGY